MSPTHHRSRGFGELLRELAHGSAELIRGEVKLARLEVGGIAAQVGVGAVQVAIGGVLLLLGGLSLAAGLILLVGDQWLPDDRYWVAALIVTVVAGVLAAWMARRGRAHISANRLVPDQTIETLEEDRKWLKRRLTSDGT